MSLLDDFVAIGKQAGSTAVNAAILGKDKAAEIAMRAAEQDQWSKLNGSGPNDRAGALSDAAKGPVQSRGFFGAIASNSTALIVLGVAAAALVCWFLLRRQ